MAWADTAVSEPDDQTLRREQVWIATYMMSLYQCELVLAALFFPLCMCEFVWSSNPHADTWHCGPHALSGARQPWNHAVFILHTSLAWLKAVCRADSARRLSLFMKTQNFIIYSLMTNANEKYLYVTELLYNVWLLIPRGLRWLRVLSPFSFSLFLASPFCLLGLCKKKKSVVILMPTGEKHLQKRLYFRR